MRVCRVSTVHDNRAENRCVMLRLHIHEAGFGDSRALCDCVYVCVCVLYALLYGVPRGGAVGVG